MKSLKSSFPSKKLDFTLHIKVKLVGSDVKQVFFFQSYQIGKRFQSTQESEQSCLFSFLSHINTNIQHSVNAFLLPLIT